MLVSVEYLEEITDFRVRNGITATSVLLGAERNETTKSIDAKWSMSVWHAEESEIIYSRDVYKETFDIQNRGFGKLLTPNQNLFENHNYTVIINISKWIVNNY